MSDQR